MITELDTVVLTRDVPEHGLVEGDVGAVVFVHEGARAFEVEFLSAHGGGTVAVLTLEESDVRHLTEGEILNARRIETT